MSRTWVNSETCSPAWAASPIRGPAMEKTMMAGSTVRMGASTDRNTRNNRARMKMIENSSVRLPALLEALWLSTPAATSPARWTLSPAGTGWARMVERRSSTSVLSAFIPPCRLASTRSSVAWPSGDTPTNWTDCTLGTALVAAWMPETAVWSATVSCDPDREATMGTGTELRGWNGVANFAAWRLGELDGRKVWLLALTALLSVGRAAPAAPAPTIQAITIRYRNLTEKRPTAARNVMRLLPGDLNRRDTTRCARCAAGLDGNLPDRRAPLPADALRADAGRRAPPAGLRRRRDRQLELSGGCAALSAESRQAHDQGVS